MLTTTVLQVSSLFAAILVLLSGAPLMVALLLLALALFVGLSVSSALTKWVGISLLMVFAGGMMVSFIYITALAHNVKFYLNFFKTGAIIVISYLLFSSPPCIRSQESTSSLKQLYLVSGGPLIFLMVFFLLLVLVLVGKLSQSFKGALLHQQ